MELRRLEVARRASQSRFEHIASTSPDGIICASAEGSITVWNAAAERLFGYTAADAIGRSIDLIVPERMRGGHGGGMQRVAGGGEPRLVGKTVELPACHADGTEFPIELSLSLWHEDGRTAFGAIVRDIRERKANEEQLFRLAHFDPLTELPNRTVLRDRLSEITAAARPIAVMMLDLDGFKEINDSHGHTTGDAILREVAARLLRCLRPTDMVSRLGGDEFVMLLPDLGDPLRATTVQKRSSLRSPRRSSTRTKHSVSVPVSASPCRQRTVVPLTSCSHVLTSRCIRPRTTGETATGCSPP